MVVVLIPAYNPGESLVALVESLVRHGMGRVVVVNDGSIPSCRPVFDKLTMMEACHVLHFPVNRGKGRALKTGYEYAYVNYPGLSGVVTADADGQHLPKDIVKVSAAFLLNPGTMVIGARKFTGAVPFRSLFGNMMMKLLFALVAGKWMSDTQSGLRCAPRDLLPVLVALSGERYEYEMNVLGAIAMLRIPVIEEMVSTVYIDGNSSSHFSPVRDSLQIISALSRLAFLRMLGTFS